ncbi:CRIB domain-containing protein RIC7-like [Vigna unguiculata]|uniref:CRIB domain-containing protein RIC7-like n=1 Tax=Vigna unguiculata TaxID=3917 RepID=UPI0010163620|nr:CRIB domain-containing protein RIC7-like [Vigna unguiculata]
MSTKVKGFLKGFKYISQIFDEKEEQFQIGMPTDVKHVAHIGSDDPSANAPSWMTEFKGGTKETSSVGNPNPEGEREKSSKNSKSRHNAVPKSRSNQSMEAENNAPRPKGTRRSQRSSDTASETSNQDSSTGGSRHRRNRRGSNPGGESPSSQDMPPRGSRRKSKNLEDGSVKKSGRSSKGDSLSDISISDFGSGSESGPLEPIRV